ncbi:regulatory LuxR family protein [Arcticibacter tournemirensis]|uniref:Helix-turn-helix transcriptional regulator n=1 Tax=Arcticibacter tournemirensis TaxID=699437 RepID=A0A5M9HFH4_9SPHI|nr:helix-turn-helix transcriptional regulator [Arcticibacter tournemirensis]KAA8485550.1 helix-turn-helix transcriptional regulator [Arcticibacter tournemirensis]TQM48736.1 regulatory LuxR family protein [Arcticibacter tournemirensis]
MENIRKLLDNKLFSQSFAPEADLNAQLENAKFIAQLYSRLENCISVLSDMKARRSYIYYGAVAERLGIHKRKAEINSIWEDELLSRIHAEDLQKKYRLEFQFFQLLNSIEGAERPDYRVVTKLRIRNREGKQLLLEHRLLYISSSAEGTAWLALCLYNIIYDHPEFGVPKGVILNTRTGAIIDPEERSFNEMLSAREKEILQLIKLGRRSKEIAEKLSLSIHTVNRHRQNIFQKLNVTNALEACRVADGMGVL